jgi:hypothetical protein
VKRYGKSKEKEVKLKSFGKYRRKVIWIAKWYGKYRRKESGIVIRYGQ